MHEQNLVEVYRAKNSPAAHLLKAALEDAGITAVVEGDLLQGALGEVPLGWSSAPKVLVESGDVSKAREIIRQIEAAQADDHESHHGETCLSCGAALEEYEDTCPECGWSYRHHAGEIPNGQ